MVFVRQDKDRRASSRIPKGFGAAWRKVDRSKRNCFIGKQYNIVYHVFCDSATPEDRVFRFSLMSAKSRSRRRPLRLFQVYFFKETFVVI